MTNEQKMRLAQIYNTLMNVQTSGENSFMMTDCLRALQALMQAINDNEQNAAVE